MRERERDSCVLRCAGGFTVIRCPGAAGFTLMQHAEPDARSFIPVSCPHCSTKRNPVMIHCDPSWPTGFFQQCEQCNKQSACEVLKHRYQRAQWNSKRLPKGTKHGGARVSSTTFSTKVNRKRLSIPSAVDVGRISKKLKTKKMSEVLSIFGSTAVPEKRRPIRNGPRTPLSRSPPLGLTIQDWQDVTSALFAPTRACSQCWTTFTSEHVVHKTLHLPVSYSLCPTCFQASHSIVTSPQSIVFNDTGRNITPGMGSRTIIARMEVPSASTYVVVAPFCIQCNSPHGFNPHRHVMRTMNIAILQFLPQPSWAYAQLRSWECSECAAEVCPTLLDTATHGLFPIHCSTYNERCTTLPSARITLDLSAPGRPTFIQHGSITWLLHLRMGAHLTNRGMVEALVETAHTLGCPFTPCISSQIRTDLLRVITMYGKSLTQRRTALLPHDLAACLACAKRPKHPNQTVLEASLGGLSCQIWDGGSFASHSRRGSGPPVSKANAPLTTEANDPLTSNHDNGDATSHRLRWREPDPFDVVLDSGHALLQDRSWLRSWLQIAAPTAASADVDDAPDSSSCSASQRKMQCDNTPTSLDAFDTNLQNNTTFVGMCCHGILLRNSIAMTPGALTIVNLTTVKLPIVCRS